MNAVLATEAPSAHPIKYICQYLISFAALIACTHTQREMLNFRHWQTSVVRLNIIDRGVFAFSIYSSVSLTAWPFAVPIDMSERIPAQLIPHDFIRPGAENWATISSDSLPLINERRRHTTVPISKIEISADVFICYSIIEIYSSLRGPGTLFGVQCAQHTSHIQSDIQIEWQKWLFEFSTPS